MTYDCSETFLFILGADNESRPANRTFWSGKQITADVGFSHCLSVLAEKITTELRR